MLHSTFHNKDTNEDPKTSSVFENLILLPDNVFWRVLRGACFDNYSIPAEAGMLKKYEFWPRWDPTGTDNDKYVEPDIFFQFENFDVVIEAKYGDNCGQYYGQWEKEIISYQNEYGRKKPIVIAVGGSSSKDNNIVTIGNMPIIVYNCSWQSLLDQVIKYKRELSYVTKDGVFSARDRLLDNIILAFNINSIYSCEWFETMLDYPFPSIDPNSIEIIQTAYTLLS